MQKKIFYLFMILCTVSFFSSCKDDDKIDDGPKTDWAEEIAGTYKGDLGVTVDGNDLGSSTQFIYISRENTNVTKLELRNFKIMIAGTALQVGDITVSNIPVTDANTTVMLEQTSTVINHQALGQLNVTVSGTITNGKAALQITVFAVTLGQNIEVSVVIKPTKWKTTPIMPQKLQPGMPANPLPSQEIPSTQNGRATVFPWNMKISTPSLSNRSI